MLPTREQAEALLLEAEKCNPGPWGNHSRVTAHCAEKIALECGDLDAEKAYILGLLHDIGRKFGVKHLGHVYDGYTYMLSLGYDEVAQICLTHSFNNQSTSEYIGKFDITPEELQMLQDALAATKMDDYDRLIQLCDSLAGAEGVLDIEERMGDVKRRYGMYPEAKWNSNLAIKKYFEDKMGKDVYVAVDKANFNRRRKMTRYPFVVKCKPDKKEEGIKVLCELWGEIKEVLDQHGADNVSVWGIEDFLFCYGEYPENFGIPAERKAVWEKELSPYLELFAAPGMLPLMYHDIGIVREDKSLIRHRVFATRLKEGCAEEYKARHDALIEARGDLIKEGPESNFTIWNANGYIFGYCELVKAFDHEMTEEEKADTIAWETRQLEIMDWLTDDVDWISGQKHEAIRLICRQ